MRSVAVVTVARSDYGIYRPLLHEIRDHDELRLQLVAGGMHLDPHLGATIDVVRADGFEPAARVPMNLANDDPEGVATSLGVGVTGFASAYRRLDPDLVVVLGDRFEMFAAAAAAVPFTLPIVHIHGGEVTAGAVDDVFRHAITKMSHLHFPATDAYADRVVQMGEDPERVHVSGAPGLDNVRRLDRRDPRALEADYGFEVGEETLVVTYHPETLSEEETRSNLDELVSALTSIDNPLIVTAPNADASGRLVLRRLQELAENRPATWLVDNLGPRDYFSILKHAGAMVGNSSSGLIEAPSFGLPVVNVGDRQQGRLRAENVIDVGHDAKEILEGIRTALEPAFRGRLSGLENPYGDGTAAPEICQVLAGTPLDNDLVKKRFNDLPSDAIPP